MFLILHTVVSSMYSHPIIFSKFFFLLLKKHMTTGAKPPFPILFFIFNSSLILCSQFLNFIYQVPLNIIISSWFYYSFLFISFNVLDITYCSLQYVFLPYNFFRIFFFCSFKNICLWAPTPPFQFFFSLLTLV